MEKLGGRNQRLHSEYRRNYLEITAWDALTLEARFHMVDWLLLRRESAENEASRNVIALLPFCSVFWARLFPSEIWTARLALNPPWYAAAFVPRETELALQEHVAKISDAIQRTHTLPDSLGANIVLP